jgi:hypothetical protein
VPFPQTDHARGHLRLASAPADPGAARRVGARLGAGWVAFVARWRTATAWAASGLALMPLLLRRKPAGRRLRARSAPRARVIPFPGRKRALPR